MVTLGLLVYTALVAGVCKRFFDKRTRPKSIVVPNILQDVIRYESHEYRPAVDRAQDLSSHPFFGSPSEALEENWQRLLRCQCHRVRGAIHTC